MHALSTRAPLSLAAASMLALVFALPAGANDSTAELRTGGLVLTKTDSIEMRSEDLFISPTLVRVKYRFANTSGQDVTTTVAFPMPDITTNGYDDVLSIPVESADNFLAFSTLVDGKPVKAAVEQKAVKGGVDQTAHLRKLGVPLAPHLGATAKALDRLPKPAQAELLKKGLAVQNDYDAGNGMEHHIAAAWTLKTTYFWTQIFPAGRELAVEHRYKPSVGESAGTSWGSNYGPKGKELAAARAKYCVDDGFMASIRRVTKPGEGAPPFNEARIDYILTSGANWKAPIADFHMTIDKGEAKNLLSFCGTGVKKTGPTTFEVRYADYTPTREVAVLILKPLTPQ